MNNQFLEIQLENYACPRQSPATKAYYGTIKDIQNLTAFLDSNYNTSIRYRQTIDAVAEYCSFKDVNHYVAGKLLPVLSPVQLIYEWETVLKKQIWIYTTHTGVVYPCYAEEVHISQILIQTKDGYERCLKGVIHGLLVCYQGTSLLSPNGCVKGFPGAITYNEHCYSMNLYVSQAHYGLDDVDAAVMDMMNASRIDLSVIVADILAEG